MSYEDFVEEEDFSLNSQKKKKEKERKKADSI